MKYVVFVHGAGEGACQADALMAESSRDALGRACEVVPFQHLALYAARLPLVAVRPLDAGGHQLGNDLSSVAHDIDRRG